MKDEIKEILDNLKYTAKKHTIQVLENGEKIEHCPQEIETELRLNTYSANILLDYITNLQEENKRLKEEIENLTHIVANKIIEDYDIDTPLKNQLNEERIKYINLDVVCNDYKSRCEKAIQREMELSYLCDTQPDEELLNILQGEDTDVKD